jgi:hypothetical protein
MGGLVGYVMFLTYLESKPMGNIIFRDGIFSPLNIVRYMINPFIACHLWHPSLLRANWIIMTCLGSIIGYMIQCGFEFFAFIFDFFTEFY